MDEVKQDELERLKSENEVLRQRVAQLEARFISQIEPDAAWMRELLEAVPMGVTHVTLNGHVVFANAEAQRILGLSYNDLEQRFVNDFSGKTFREDGSECPVVEYPVVQCLMTGQAQPPMLIGVQQPGGGVTWSVFTAVPVREGEGHTGAVVTFLDVTRLQEDRLEKGRLEAEIQRHQKIDELGKLAGGVAHDMNNVLATLISVALGLRSDLEGQQALWGEVDLILQTCLRGQEMVRNLLKFGRRNPVERGPVQLNEVCRDVYKLMERAVRRDVTLKLALGAELPMVKGSASQLAHVLMNLCINASDAIKGEGEIVVSTRSVAWDEVDQARFPRLEPGPCVELKIVDNGAGLAPHILKRALEPFVTSKGDSGGTGLGLAMVQDGVLAHGGDLVLSSPEGGGFVVEILLPAMPPEVQVAAVPVQPVNGWLREGRDLVLLVDDEAQKLWAHWKVVRALGLRAELASNGLSAMDVVQGREDELGAILLDRFMPGMDGAEVLVRVRGQENAPPVIVMLEGEDEDEAQRLMEAGAAAVWIKPLVQGKVEAMLGRRVREDHPDMRST